MADATGVYDLGMWTQAGLSTGVPLQMPWGGGVWRRAIAVPFNVTNVLSPVPTECQIWPQYGIEQTGTPST
jgi:hypothetical protein